MVPRPLSWEGTPAAKAERCNKSLRYRANLGSLVAETDKKRARCRGEADQPLNHNTVTTVTPTSVKRQGRHARFEPQ